MPNWCWNELEVSGPKEDIASFREAVMPNDISERIELVSRLMPLPEDATIKIIQPDGTEISTFTEEGYWKAIELWGSKWADAHTELNADEPNFLSFNFDSAWGPPEAGIIGISTLYPELTFTLCYYEANMGFRGDLQVKNGEKHFEHYDDDWSPDYEMMDAAELTEEEIERAQDIFWGDYSGAIFDFTQSAVEISRKIVDELLKNRSQSDG